MVAVFFRMQAILRSLFGLGGIDFCRGRPRSSGRGARSSWTGRAELKKSFFMPPCEMNVCMEAVQVDPPAREVQQEEETTEAGQGEMEAVQVHQPAKELSEKKTMEAGQGEGESGSDTKKRLFLPPWEKDDGS